MPFLRYLVVLQLSPCNSSCHSMSVHLALNHSMLSLHHFLSLHHSMHSLHHFISLPAPPSSLQVTLCQSLHHFMSLPAPLSVTPSLPVSPCSTLSHTAHPTPLLFIISCQSLLLPSALPVILCQFLQHYLLLSITVS